MITEETIIITGEWCHGAKDDYGISGFAGRAIQYHLGFHSSQDICRYGHPLLFPSL